MTVGAVLFFLYDLFLLLRWKKLKTKNNFILRSTMEVDIIIFLFGLLIFRMIQVQIFEARDYKKAISRQVNIEKKEYGERGRIFDTKGKQLAHNKNIYELSVDPKRFITLEKSSEVLKELIDKKYVKGKHEELFESITKFGNQGRVYKKLSDNIDEIEKKEIEEILKRYEINGKNILFLKGRKERSYYMSNLYFFLIGNIGFKNDTNKEGIFGLEYFYEKYLKGEKSSKIIPTIRSIGIGLPTAEARTKVNLEGMDLYLTIDDELQYILNDEVEKQYKKTKSEEAYAIIMNPNNGKILATSFFRKNKKNVVNPIFQSQFEPGSIFKPLIVAATLNENKISKNSKFNIGDGRIKRYNHQISESSRSIKGVLNVEDILKKSSNIGMVLIGDKFTNEEFDTYLEKFGFYDKTEVDYPYEKKPNRMPIKKWDGLKKSTMSFGQGIAVTPIQLITAFSSIINGGILYKPYIVEKITERDGTVVRRNLPVIKRQVISPKVSKEMREMMELTVLEGTATKAKVEGYSIGGKTGTAQFSEKGRYVKNDYLSSILGFFPVEKPEYAILIMFFKPQGNVWYEKSGGTTAAPVLGEIVKRIAKSKNIQSKNIENIRIGNNKSNIKNVFNNTQNIVQTVLIMPDLKGISAREVLEIFKDSNIDINISGVGVVKKQFPSAGTDISGIKQIKVELD